MAKRQRTSRKILARPKRGGARTKRPKTVAAQIQVVEVPKELVMVVALPAPLAQPPVLTWQAKGKRLAIRVKQFVLKNV
jgi:hypothetical protein